MWWVKRKEEGGGSMSDRPQGDHALATLLGAAWCIVALCMVWLDGALAIMFEIAVCPMHGPIERHDRKS